MNSYLIDRNGTLDTLISKDSTSNNVKGTFLAVLINPFNKNCPDLSLKILLTRLNKFKSKLKFYAL